MSKSKSKQCIVIYDDNVGLTVPQSFDPDCDGALCSMLSDSPVAVFASPSDARKAIRISVAFAKLCKEQGRPVNMDYLTCVKCLKIVPLVEWKAGG